MLPRCPILRRLVIPLAVAIRDFAQNIAHHFIRPIRFQFSIHSTQRHAYDISMMQFGARTAFAQLQPQPVHQVNVLRPQSRRVWPEIEKENILLVLENDFQR